MKIRSKKNRNEPKNNNKEKVHVNYFQIQGFRRCKEEGEEKRDGT